MSYALTPGSIGPGHANLFLPRPLWRLRPGEIPLGTWCILVNVYGQVHVSYLWAIDSDPCECYTAFFFSTKSTVYEDDEDADWWGFIVEAYPNKDAACHRAVVIGNAYALTREEVGSPFEATTGMRAMAEWRRRLPQAPQF